MMINHSTGATLQGSLTFLFSIYTIFIIGFLFSNNLLARSSAPEFLRFYSKRGGGLGVSSPETYDTFGKEDCNICGFSITTADGTEKGVLFTGAEHEFFYLDENHPQGVWVKACEITQTKLVSANGEILTFTANKELFCPDTKFCFLWLKDDHNFFVTTEDILIQAEFSAEREGFSEGTLVKTPAGHVEIKNLKVDDLVCSVDENGQLCERKVLSTQSIPCKNLLGFTLSSADGTEVNNIFTATDQKFFYVEEDGKGCWKPAGKIEKAKVINHERELFDFVRTENTPSNTCVCSISVEKDQNYFITTQNILVHNFAPAIPFAITIVWSEAGLSVLGPTLATTAMLGVQYLFRKKSSSNTTPTNTKPGGGGGGPSGPEDPNKLDKNPLICPNPDDHHKNFWQRDTGIWIKECTSVGANLSSMGLKFTGAAWLIKNTFSHPNRYNTP